ncbi:hypothetical protein J6O86_06955 [bacterium]|nr:hypothetical protein [bacterium]
MKKILASLFLIFAFAGTSFGFEEIFVEEKPPVAETEMNNEQKPAVEVAFDWFEIQSDDKAKRINEYREIIFGENSKINLSKEEFKKELSKYKKDTNFKHHYMLANNGVTEDEDAKYNPFYYKNGTLVIYAIMYNNDIHHALYYNPYGKLYYVDITSDNYPDYPYYSMQYDRKGNLKSAIYFVSHDIQYMYNTQGDFIGVWYKDKMYNGDGKEISTREGW